MRLRTLLSAALFLLACTVQAGALPNIVVIMTDDMRADDVETMPKLRDLIARNGITFTNSFVTFSLCCPSRANFERGQTAHNTGIKSNGPPDGGEVLFQALDANTLPVWLKAKGYHTSLIGKYMNGYGLKLDGSSDFASQTRKPPGWDDWQANLSGEYYNYVLSVNGAIQGPFGSAPADYETDVMGARAVSFVTTATQPFFLWHTPIAPHLGGGGDEPEFADGPQPAPRHIGVYRDLPLPMPPGFNQPPSLWVNTPSYLNVLPTFDQATFEFVRDTFRNRRESLLAVDDWIGHIVKALTDRGVLSNTIIIFTSDNGWSQGEHRRHRGKQVILEESSRVPLIISGPGVAFNERREQMVSNLDVTATIIELATATAGVTQDGRSLVPLFPTGASPTWRTALLLEGADSPYGSGPASFGYTRAIRTKDWIYVDHDYSADDRELYHLARDRWALANRGSNVNYASLVATFAATLATLKTCAGASCWITAAQPDQAVADIGSVRISQSKNPTRPGEPWTLSWNSVDAGRCAVQTSDQLTLEIIGGTTSGSVTRSRPVAGREHYFIDCASPGGTIRSDLYHDVN